MRICVSGLFAVLTLASVNTHGAEGCCVEPDIAAAFMRNSYLSREYPSDLPAIPDVPDGFELIGSHRWFNRRQTIVAWRTDASTDVAQAAIRDVLTRDGWRSVPTTGYLRNGGFVGRRQQAMQQVRGFCHDDLGHLSLDVWESSVGTTISLSRYQQRGRTQSCAEMIDSMARSRTGMELMQFLPTLELPSGVPNDGSGSGGGGDEAHSTTTVKTEVQADEILAYFDPQMRDQGWAYDTAYSGFEVHGSIWRRTIDSRTLLCMLKIIDLGESVKMRMTVERI